MSVAAEKKTPGNNKTQIVVDIISDPNCYWAWPSKRRVEKVAPQFSDQADFTIRFQPFQLYPELPAGDNLGVDKAEFFKRLHTMRNGGMPVDPAEAEARRRFLADAWKAEGLNLAVRKGRWGQSFDAQRLISLSRKQGRENEMTEEIYKGNHELNQPLSEWSFLLAAAEKAGVKGAKEMLESDQEAAEVKAKIQKHINMGISAVPVLVINDRKIIHGAPENELLSKVFADEIKKQSAAL